MRVCGIPTIFVVLRNDLLVKPDLTDLDHSGPQVAIGMSSNLTNAVGSDKNFQRA
jgi:hypothetical protein